MAEVERLRASTSVLVSSEIAVPANISTQLEKQGRVGGNGVFEKFEFS